MKITTKTELRKALEYFAIGASEKLFTCNARTYTKVMNINDTLYIVTILKSYSTIVACYIHETDTLIVLDKYSATTYQHVNKFSRIFNPSNKVFLYRNSISIAYETPTVTYKWHKKSYESALEDDFAEILYLFLN